MGKLSVDAGKLRECVSQLMGQATEVEDIFYKTKTIYAQISDAWDGAASRAYLDRLTKQQKELTALDNVIRNYATAINSVAREMEEQDRREEEYIRSMQMITMVTDPVGYAGQKAGEYVGQKVSEAVSGNKGSGSNIGASLGAIGGGLGNSGKKKK